MRTGVAAGLLSTALMYGLAARLLRSQMWGLVAAVIFALTPVLLLQSLRSTGPHLALPFVMAWLVCVVRFSDGSEAGWLLAAGVMLGCGLYSHLASLVMMPAYLALTIAWLAAVRQAHVRALAFCIVGFGLAAMPGALFVAWHPDYLPHQINAFRIYDANRFDFVHGLREVVSWVGLTARSEVYYDSFNPWFLFLQGGSFGESVCRPQVLLLPLAVLLPAGFHGCVTRQRTPMSWLLIGAFLLAPCAAALVAEPYVARRIVFIVPFAAVIAAIGLRHLLSYRSAAIRLLALSTMAAIPICFALY